LKEIIEEICERYWFEVDEVGTDWDHVHLFIWASPSTSPSKIMQVMKSITARELLKRFPENKRILRWGAFRSEGGYIWTVGEWTNEDIVKKYIQNQADETERESYKQLRLFRLRE
jgi:putative transposase